VTLAADGSYSYDPRAASELQALNTGGALSDTFSYTVNDGRGGTSTGQVQVTVTGVTDGTPPTNTINGTTGNDTLTGKDGVNNTINGNAGNDTLYGHSGDDTLRGGTGVDVLIGEAGNDRFDGGLGNDVLFGGAGNDRFAFARGSGQDLIADFTAGQDKIDLSAFGLGSMTKLAASASLVSTGANTMYIDFGAGDRLTIFGVNKLTADNVVF
jgi:VCBS repeat-containing protein